jgi:hypothetical protein
MKNILLFLLAYIAATAVCGQTQIMFQKVYNHYDSFPTGNVAYTVAETAEGGYIAAGTTTTGGGNSTNYFDMYLLKIDAQGTLLWAKTFGGPMQDYANSVCQLTGGDFIVLGSTHSFGAGKTDMYLVRTDNNGNLLWSRTYGGTGFDEGRMVDLTSDGGFLLAGSTYDLANTLACISLIKTDGTGQIVWSKIYHASDKCEGYSVRQTSDGGIIIAGVELIDLYTSNIYMIKTDGNGNLQWSKTYLGLARDCAYYAGETSDGGYIVTGETFSYGWGYGDAFLLRTDPAGNLKWFKTFGSYAYNNTGGHDYGKYAAQTTDNGFMMAGVIADVQSFYTPRGYLVKTDSSGTLLWSNYYGGDNISSVNSGQLTPDGGMILGGDVSGFTNNDEDVYLVKTDENGNTGCYNSTAETYTTSATPQFSEPNTIVETASTISSIPNTNIGNVGTDSTICLLVSTVNLHEENTLSLYPNPFSTTTTLHLDRHISNATLMVFNIYGQLVRQTDNLSGSTIIFNRDNLKNGLYFIRLIKENTTVANLKILITN